MPDPRGRFPKPAKPIQVDGGIRARSKRGAIGETWWSRRFIEVLESFGMGGRLQRGKRYARAGQVLNLTLSTSVVVGLVQGSRPQPYRARIGIKAFTAAEWRRVETELAGQALYAAKLLAGEMPTDLEQVFADLGLELFPATMRELTMDCSCPDWEIPCKHLAATCYLLAESFDEDPFQILAWRGRGRDELLDRLRTLRGTVAAPVTEDSDDSSPLPLSPDDFWSAGDLPSTEAPETGAPPAAILNELDPIPVKAGATPLLEALRPAYHVLPHQN